MERWLVARDNACRSYALMHKHYHVDVFIDTVSNYKLFLEKYSCMQARVHVIICCLTMLVLISYIKSLLLNFFILKLGFCSPCYYTGNVSCLRAPY